MPAIPEATAVCETIFADYQRRFAMIHDRLSFPPPGLREVAGVSAVMPAIANVRSVRSGAMNWPVESGVHQIVDDADEALGVFT
jgi:hypothetical protein